jgi:hypothetical protein
MSRHIRLPQIYFMSQTIKVPLSNTSQSLHELLQSRPFLDVEGAAKYLYISLSSMQKLSARRIIPVYKPRGGKAYYFISDLDEYVKNGRSNTSLKLAFGSNPSKVKNLPTD